jgi:hypothetical protein
MIGGAPATVAEDSSRERPMSASKSAVVVAAANMATAPTRNDRDMRTRVRCLVMS